MGMIFGLENIEKRKESYSLITHDIVENADVCVIGSGAAGAILACKLAESGRSVVLLEKGGYYDPEDMNQREVDMIPLLWKNAGAIFTDDLRIAIAQGQCLGGSTVINDAVCFKTPQIVREQWRELGVNISEERWEKALDEVWKGVYVNKVMPEALNENNRMLKKACEMKGYKGDTNDRNSVECFRCGFVHLGCHYGTKQDMLATYIRRAVRNTEIKIYCNCAAEKITYTNDIANGVEASFVDAANNVRYKMRVNAKVIIISAGAIASTQILLRNKIAVGKAGKGMTLHPASFLLGRFEKEINGFRGIPMAYTCHEFGVTNGVREGGFLIEGIFLPIFQFATALPAFFIEHAEMMKELVHYTMAGVMIRDEPKGTITLSENGNPKIHYKLSPNDVKNMAKGLEILAELWFDVGAKEVITGHLNVNRLRSKDEIPKLINAVKNNPDALQMASAHPQGGNRMGEDPDTCVVDSNCRVHGFKNLFVCDASVFPTAVGVNPQITVMAIAAMTADYIKDNWNNFNIPLIDMLGETCSIKQPMYCSMERLEAMYDKATNSLPIDTLINSNRWSFDKDTLMIYNDRYWKGFFPTDQSFTMIRYFGGFWKRFYNDNGIKGITHPFETNIDAPNIPELKNFPRYGDVIYLKYTSPEFSLFYDLLKIVDQDTILGKAFFGTPPFGIPILTFSMSRRYSVDFMTEEDHETIYQQHARAPTEDEVLGIWQGKLVSDSALTPVTQTFTYRKNERLEMEYVFARILRGISRVTLTPEEMNMYDFTNWHDEIRIVKKDFMIGKWCSPWTNIPLNFGPSFLSVESGEEGKRFVIRFILRRL